MGKRKKATKPPPKKKRPKLNKQFDCPFCGHEETVDCYLEREEKVGRVECRVCGAKFRAIINHLDEEIDLYHKWIDACEEASKDDKAAAAVKNMAQSSSGHGHGSGDNFGRLSSGSGHKRSVEDIVNGDDDDFDDEAEDDLG